MAGASALGRIAKQAKADAEERGDDACLDW